MAEFKAGDQVWVAYTESSTSKRKRWGKAVVHHMQPARLTVKFLDESGLYMEVFPLTPYTIRRSRKDKPDGKA